MAKVVSPPDPYRIVNDRLVRGNEDVCSVGFVADEDRVLFLESMNIAYQRGFLDGYGAGMSVAFGDCKKIIRGEQ